MYTIEKETEETVENYLNSKKIPFTKDVYGETSSEVFYTLMIGSEECHIKLEFSEEKNEKFICCSFFIDAENQNLYYNSPGEIENKFGIECEIDELIDATKNYVKGIAKIKAKIEDIIELCDDYNIAIGIAIDIFDKHND